MVEGGRAGRARGACTNPRVCVRACVGLAPPAALSCPGGARRGAEGPRGAGRSFPSVCPGSRAGCGGSPEGMARRWGSAAPPRLRPDHGGFLRRGRGGSALLDDEAAGQVLREVLEELGGGPGAVGQLQLLQFLKLHQARQSGGGQQRAAYGGAGVGVSREVAEWARPHCSMRGGGARRVEARAYPAFPS